MLKLDMSTAFDLLPRQSLVTALEWAGCSSELVHLIITWHESCHYHVRHGTVTHPVPLLRGIRQDAAWHRCFGRSIASTSLQRLPRLLVGSGLIRPSLFLPMTVMLVGCCVTLRTHITCCAVYRPSFRFSPGMVWS